MEVIQAERTGERREGKKMMADTGVDVPEPEACTYISGGPASPALERKQGHPHLKAWAMDPTLPKRSPKVQDT